MSVDSHEPGEKETQGRVLDPHHPASPEAGVGTLGSPHGAYEITTSYRDTYGGNRGTSIDGWRSASTSPVKATRTGGDAGQSAPGEAEPGEGAEPVVAPVETTTVRMTGAIMGRVAIAKYNPLEDIAVLTTGQVLRHRDAMESLVGALKACSLDSSRETSHDQLEGLATSSLIATNGGTHLMTVNLIESSDREMRDLCAQGLVEMFLREPSALEEVASSRETVSKLLGMSVREILGGRGSNKLSSASSSAASCAALASSSHGQLFKMLVEFPSEHVSKSCAEHKIVHKLVERLGIGGATHGPRASAAIRDQEAMVVLSMLQTMIDTGNEYYASSFVWNGALDVVLPMLASGEDLGKDRRVAIARLVASICVGRREGRSVVDAWVCTVVAVEGLSLLLADEDIATDVQILVARVLLEISSVRERRQEVLEAMVDYCLPRACEIIIDGDDGDDDDDDDDDELVAIAAAIAANLAKESVVAMEVLIFHANVLRRVVDVLVGVKSYDAGRGLLQAASAFCLSGNGAMVVAAER